MAFEIELTAKSSDDGGLAESFKRQLEELGGKSELVEEHTPLRVTGSEGMYFEAKRTYRVELD